MSLRRTCLTLIAVSLAATGCAQQKGGPKDHKGDYTIGATTVAITGYVARSAVGGYGLIELHDVSIANKNQTRTMRVFEPIKSRHIVRFEVSQPPDVDIRALLGPIPGSTRHAEARVENAVANVYLVYGWIYATGRRPCIRTRWVTGCADGSTIAVQTREGDSPPVHRFFFIEGSRAQVNAVNSNATVVLSKPMTYVDVDAAGVISDINDVTNELDGMMEAVAASNI